MGLAALHRLGRVALHRSGSRRTFFDTDPDPQHLLSLLIGTGIKLRFFRHLICHLQLCWWFVCLYYYPCTGDCLMLTIRWLNFYIKLSGSEETEGRTTWSSGNTKGSRECRVGSDTGVNDDICCFNTFKCCQSHCFWVEPEPFLFSRSGSYCYFNSYQKYIFLMHPKVMLSLTNSKMDGSGNPGFLAKPKPH